MKIYPLPTCSKKLSELEKYVESLLFTTTKKEKDCSVYYLNYPGIVILSYDDPKVVATINTPDEVNNALERMLK